MGDRPVFLLGAGAQKGGTTWVADYLRSHPDCARGFFKEYHVLDVIDLPEQVAMRGRVWRKAGGAVELGREHEPAPAEAPAARTEAAMLHRAAMVLDVARYYDYFAGLLSRPHQPRRLAVDMTPESGLLPLARLHEVRSELDRRGVEARAFYSMRDPVERVWSQLRMQSDRRPARFDASVVEVLLERHADPLYESRTRYDHTIVKLDDAFGDAVHYVFFEELFTESSVRALSDFVGLSHRPPELGTRLNASSGSSPIPLEVRRTVARHYRPVYEHVAARFDRDLTAIWPNAELALG